MIFIQTTQGSTQSWLDIDEVQSFAFWKESYNNYSGTQSLLVLVVNLRGGATRVLRGEEATAVFKALEPRMRNTECTP